MKSLFILCLLFHQCRSGPRVSPTAAWGFASSSDLGQDGTLDDNTPVMLVGSHVTLAEDSDLKCPENRFALFEESMFSYLRIANPSEMSIDNEFGLIFYLNYDSAPDLNGIDTPRVLFDSGLYLPCAGLSTSPSDSLPTLQVLVTYGHSYEVIIGDATNCVKRNVTQYSSITSGWTRHIVYIKRDSYGRCTVRLSDPTSSTNEYVTGEPSSCGQLTGDHHYFSIGDGTLDLFEVSDNFVGGLACIQFYNKEILPLDTNRIRDLCAGQSLEENDYVINVDSAPTQTNGEISTSTTTSTTSRIVTTASSTVATTTALTTGAMSTSQASPACAECCCCSCAQTISQNVSVSEVQQIVDEIIETLSIDKTSTSQEKRKRTSAQDERQSAQVLASVVGITFFTFVGACILCMDMAGICKKREEAGSLLRSFKP